MNMNKNNKHAAAGIDPQALASFANALASFANAFAILSVIRLCLMCLVCRTCRRPWPPSSTRLPGRM